MRTIKNILLVEDDKDDQGFFATAISHIPNAKLQGIADNGMDALEILSHSQTLPDFIFMDVNMPRMNGLECLTQLSQSPILKNIPVIMLSTSVREAHKALTCGAREFISKPNSEALLLKELTRILAPAILTTTLVTFTAAVA
ncbi:MAG: response regulator [Chitinophagales bacterium]|nr:response regulator [Chitinophagales bacterium]